MSKKHTLLYLAAIGLLFGLVLVWYLSAFLNQPLRPGTGFDGQRAMQDVETQVAFGPRTPGSEGHAIVLEWMRAQLEAAGWKTQLQTGERMGQPIKNLVAYREEGPPRFLLGAHYDTRLLADSDPDASRRADPVPGANDGASGVAVLLEVARSLPAETAPTWLVFFDAEDNGRIPGWDWILGSQAFVEQMDFRPEAVVIVDMVGDADQNIFFEANSDPALSSEIWQVAESLGYSDRFIPQVRHSLLDDHTPFLRAGIPAVDIIDFDYPYWHTTADTPDKLSPESLQAVGNTLTAWLEARSAE